MARKGSTGSKVDAKLESAIDDALKNKLEQALKEFDGVFVA